MGRPAMNVLMKVIENELLAMKVTPVILVSELLPVLTVAMM